MVDVFHFRVWSIPDGRYWIPPFKATRDFIKKSHGKPIAGTQEEIPLSALDEEGRYVQRKRGSNDAPSRQTRGD